METDRLMDMLAREAGPAPRAAVARRLAPVALAGAVLSIALAFWLMGPLSAASLQSPTTWIKLAYAVSLALAAGLLTSRLARPIARLKAPGLMVMLVVTTMAVFGAVMFSQTPAEQRLGALLGQTWLSCPWTLVGLSLPALAGVLWAVRGLAPTRPRQAGWAGGLFAGALGAVGYALVCPESSSVFVAVWYTAGIVLTGLIGRLLGPVVLRW